MLRKQSKRKERSRLFNDIDDDNQIDNPYAIENDRSMMPKISNISRIDKYEVDTE